MPVILVPTATTAPGPVACDSLLLLTADDAYSVNNCPVVNKTRTIIVDKGQTAVIRWELRDRSGKAIDISNCVDAGGLVFARISDPLCSGSQVFDILAEVHDASAGLVDVALSADVVAEAGIYQLQFGLLGDLGSPTFVDKALLSVERGLFGPDQNGFYGPPTLGEIRVQMRDFALANDLRGVVEFDDTEIMYSILQPVQEWNELPPAVAWFTPKTFPYHYHWLQAVCANLFKIGATWYLRNKLQVSHGGAQDDDRNRDQAYMAMSQNLRNAWLTFVRGKKYEINVDLGYGSF